MLSDLVAGAGCDVTGENNALAKLSGAIYGGLEREYARREGEGSSSSAFAGPSSDSLPPMSEEEAAFRARFTGGPSEPAASTVPSHPPSLAAVAPPSAIAPAIAPAATASLAAADPTEQAAVSEAVSGGYASGASGDVGFAEHRPPRWHPPHERSLPRGGFAPPPELVWLQEAREARARREREAVARRAARDGSEWPGGLRAEAQAQAQAQALPAASTARRGGEARGDARGEARGGRGAASAASSGTQYADEIASEMEGAWGVGAGDLDSAAAAWEGLADSGSGTGLQAGAGRRGGGLAPHSLGVCVCDAGEGCASRLCGSRCEARWRGSTASLPLHGVRREGQPALRRSSSTRSASQTRSSGRAAGGRGWCRRAASCWGRATSREPPSPWGVISASPRL